MSKVIFVHGFGVLKDARGMFSEIQKKLEEKNFECILFDLNKRDADGNIWVNSFGEQVKILSDIYSNLAIKEGEKVNIIAHSQGCLITSLADLKNINQTIFLAPPIDSESKKTIDYFSRNTKTEIDFTGISKIGRSDGSITFVPAEYWTEKNNMNPAVVYEKYLKHNKTIIIKATKDNVIENDNYENVFKNGEILSLETDHDFTGEGRGLLIKTLLEKMN